MSPVLPLTHARLPRDFKPTLPERCVNCLAPEPRRSVTIWAMKAHFFPWLIPLAILYSEIVRVTFPACSTCVWRIRLRRMLSIAVKLAVVVVAAVLVFRGVRHWVNPFRYSAVFLAPFLALIPFYILEEMLPPAVSVRLHKETLIYGFREPDFAAEFRSLNQHGLGE